MQFNGCTIQFCETILDLVQLMLVSQAHVPTGNHRESSEAGFAIKLSKLSILISIDFDWQHCDVWRTSSDGVISSKANFSEPLFATRYRFIYARLIILTSSYFSTHFQVIKKVLLEMTHFNLLAPRDITLRFSKENRKNRFSFGTWLPP